VLLSLATGACHDLAIAPYAGKGTGETILLRQLYDSLRPGDVVVADALFDNYFLACELRQRGVELVARVAAERVGTQAVASGPDGDLILWRRPNKAHGMKGEQYRTYPKTPADAAGARRCPRQGQPRGAIQGRHHDPGPIGRRQADRRVVRAEVGRGGRYQIYQSRR
jgi:hypothetical protein